MPQLREHPPADTIAQVTRAATQRELNRRAVQAIDRRLTQLEHEHADFTRRLANIEKAVKWLPNETQRIRARRRLRALGHDQQLDAFAGLHDLIDDVA
jgi:predicted  nucleic acid-binding Zn-ribbon protein